MVKILWVDDEIDLLRPHVFFLKGKGYEVDTCNNGYDAIDMVRNTSYDLIILDEMMPGMTGLETLPLIKEVRPTTPVIMVTKSEEENIMDKAIGSKIADYIIKPVNPNQVLLSIKKCVHSQQLVTEQTTADYRAEISSLLRGYYDVEVDDFYCAILPTATQYARNAIFAGLMPLAIDKIMPNKWLNDNEEGGKNQYEEDFLARQLTACGKTWKWTFDKLVRPEAGRKLIDNISRIYDADFSVIVYNFLACSCC